MKKILSTVLLVASASTAFSQERMFDSFGYEGYMYGYYIPQTDNWYSDGDRNNFEIVDEGTNGRGGSSDASLRFIGIPDNSAPVELGKEIDEDWRTQVVNRNYVFSVDFDIRNISPTETRNTFRFELYHTEVDQNSNDIETSLYAFSFSPSNGQIRALAGKSGTKEFLNIGNRSLVFESSFNKWTHIKLVYNTKTGYAEMTYGDQKIIETGNLKGDGNAAITKVEDYPEAGFVSTSPHANKTPGLIKFITTSGAREATGNTSAINNTAACDYLIDNLVVKASSNLSTISTNEILYEKKQEAIYIDQDKNLQIASPLCPKQIMLFDGNAKLVAETQNSHSLDVKHLLPGMYIVKYTQGNKTYSKRIIR